MVLEPWDEAEPPGVPLIWSRKPKFSIDGNRSCAELAVIHHLGAEGWRVFDRLVAANGGKLGGFFDVFAWRGDGEIRFDEVKVGKDRITDTQRKFVEQALRFHDLERFTVIEVAR